ncbi:MAG: nuclear transport factor 2 family protein [Pseudomonadota bacterium]
MDLVEIANALVAHCRNGTEREALDTLYADNAASVEALPFGGRPQETVGKEGITGKHDWWDSAFEVTGGDVVGPFVHMPDRFAVRFSVQGKDKASGETFDMNEVAIYTVADGKIVREEFYNEPMPMG